MELESFYFDSYAIYEIIIANPAYKRYTTGVSVITTKLNLMELYYGLLLTHNKEIAEKYYDIFAEYAVEIDDAVIKQAMEFRFANKHKNLSYVDCIGYTIARRRNTKFLTGDKEFKDMIGVEYVK